MIRLLLVASFALFTSWFSGEEKSRVIEKTFPASKSTVLSIVNSFGTVSVQEWDKSEIYIKVVTSSDEAGSASAESQLDKVHIDIRQEGSRISYNTRIDSKPEGKVVVNYMVSIPRLASFEMTNSFGDLNIGKLNTPVKLKLSYGGIHSGGFLSESVIALDFSRGEIASVSSGKMEFDYSDIEIAEIGNAEVTSKFSTLDFDVVGQMDLDIKYGEIRIGEISDLVADAHFTEFEIDKLTKRLDISTNYVSNFQVNLVDRNFEEFRFSGQYTPVYIKLDSEFASGFDFSLSNAVLNNVYPATDFHRSIRETGRSEYSGDYGLGHPTKIIKIESSYGNVKIR